jgi:flagellar motor switch protein FliM
MAEVLTQTEIDALLAAVSTGSVETEGAKAPIKKDWIAYDLASQEKFVRGRLAALQGIQERFARLFRATLSNALKKTVTVNYTQTDFVRFSDYLNNVLLPISINIVSIKDLKGHMLFVSSAKLTYALVDAYFGGAERPFSKVGGKEEFTSIENGMIQKICQMAVGDMKEAWKLNHPIQLEYVRAEANPQFVGSIHGSEMVAVSTFEVEFENLSGPFVVVLQLKALEPIQHFLNVNVTGEIPKDVEVWRDHWLTEIQEMELDVKVELGYTEKRIKEIQVLKAGDTLILNKDATGLLSVEVENLTKFLGLMGVCHGNTAIQVTDRILPKRD